MANNPEKSERALKIERILSGQIDPMGPEGQAILEEAFREDAGQAISDFERVPVEAKVRAMKVVGFKTEVIGTALFEDILDRSAFFVRERHREAYRGKPGFDAFGYPANPGVLDPLAPLPPVDPARSGFGLRPELPEDQSAEGLRRFGFLQPDLIPEARRADRDARDPRLDTEDPELRPDMSDPDFAIPEFARIPRSPAPPRPY